MIAQQHVDAPACRGVASGMQERMAEKAGRHAGFAQQLAGDGFAFEDVAFEVFDRRRMQIRMRIRVVAELKPGGDPLTEQGDAARVEPAGRLQLLLVHEPDGRHPVPDEPTSSRVTRSARSMALPVTDTVGKSSIVTATACDWTIVEDSIACMSGEADRPPSAADATALLQAWRAGDGEALDELMPIVHGELRRIAKHLMDNERSGHTLQPTALVNEAFIRLINVREVQWQNRAHFLAMAARLMRRVLVESARSRNAIERDGGERADGIETGRIPAVGPGQDVTALHDALDALAALDLRKSQVVEMRFFGGLSVEETAEVLGVSTDTVTRDWRFAKVWLLRELGGRSGE